MRHTDLFLREFGDDWVGVKCCSHALLLHVWVSVRRARAHPEAHEAPHTENVIRIARRDTITHAPHL